MKRDILHYLVEWKERANRKPLIIRGARQVGKTYTVDEFAKSHFRNYIKINLEEKPQLINLFRNKDIPTLLLDLSVLYGMDIVEGQTLLFIDEIQASPEVIMLLRYFYEQAPNLHLIAAGSLLDHTLNDIQYSMPVGRVEFCYMYPLSFNEFLMAIEQERMVEYIKRFDFREDFSPVIHQKLLEYLRLYCFIGGMPEAVKAFAKKRKLSDIERIHSEIITSLRYDFAKYGTRKQQEVMQTILNYCSLNVGKKVKFVKVDRETRSTFLKDVFKKMEYSRIIHLVNHSNAGRVPINQQISGDIFKPIFLDIGLGNHVGGIQLIGIESLLTANEGSLAEQFIGQELLVTSKPYLDTKLFYWMREEKNSNAEIDYLYQHENTIYPIEVKAGKSGTLKSLHVYLAEKKLNTAIRFNNDLPSTGNFEAIVRSGNAKGNLSYRLISLPLYLCSQLSSILKGLG